ncbi:MAG TPA: hypothetical protein VJB87_05750 [Candidatus Nanoarchaeia archaeon]|nr:hypothetical protein [Candidatus Nanoarchaeia archaeon]
MASDSYYVSRRGETLSASLFDPTSVEIRWRTEHGALHKSLIENGLERVTEGIFGNGEPALKGKRGTYIPDYVITFKEMGPKLREQLPPEWLSILGDWLKGDDRRYDQTLDRPTS